MPGATKRYMGNVSIEGLASGLQTVEDKAADYTVTAADRDKLFRFTGVTTQYITLPGGLPIGFTVYVVQWGAGAVQFENTGSTCGPPSTRRLAGQWAAASAEVVATNVWYLNGQLIAASAFDPVGDIAWAKLLWASDPLQTPPSDGAAVSSWRNAGSLSTAFVQATTGQQPVFRASVAGLNSKPAIEFNAPDDLLAAPIGSNSPIPYSMVIIARSDNLSTNRAKLSGVMFSDLSFNPGSGAMYVYAGGTGIDQSGSPNTATWRTSTSFYAGAVVNTGATGKLMWAGQQLTGTPGTGTGSTFVVGNGDSAAIVDGWDGWIAFAGLFHGDITVHAKYAQLLTWANTFYGVTTT